jgi:predicted dehydrogenase
VAVQLVAEGAIGHLALIRAALSVSAPPGDIRRTSVLGGGAVLDLGCYCISAIRLFGGQPLQVRAVQVPDPAPVRRVATCAWPQRLRCRTMSLASSTLGWISPVATSWS